MASVWVKPVSGSASDVKLYYDKGAAALGTSVSSGSSTKTSGSWKLINLKINGSDILNNTTVINIGCRNDHSSVDAYVDDFRFQPLNAGTAAYVYDGNSGELTHILDNNNLYTRFEYDPSGKLTTTYREKLGVGEYKTNEYQTNFGTLTTYSNQAINEYFIKNNCSPGQMGSIHSINVAAGVYTSVISLDDANAKARDYAQIQANSIGSCGTTASLLLRKMVTSSTSYVAYVNGSTYNFPASGGTTFTIAPGTHSISVQVLSGPSVSNTFRLSVPGFADNVISGTSASWSNIIVPYQSTATILIEQ
jgi:YD repeat-containing protein